MQCPNCEADLPDNAEACPWCGTVFTSKSNDASPEVVTQTPAVSNVSQEPEVAPQVAPAQVSPAPVQPSPIPSGYDDSAPSPDASKRKLSPVVWVIIGGLLLVAICCVLLFLLGVLSA